MFFVKKVYVIPILNPNISLDILRTKDRANRINFILWQITQTLTSYVSTSTRGDDTIPPYRRCEKIITP